jgi:hypothetical protein
MNQLASLGLALALCSGLGCDPDYDTGPLRARHAAVLVEGCTLDGWQQATLDAPATKQVIGEVVLRCLALHEDGSITPTDATSRSALASLTSSLRSQGYQTSLAVTAHSDDGTDYAPSKLLAILQDDTLRNRATLEITAFAPWVDTIDLALPPLPDSGAATFTQWVGELSIIRPATHLSLCAPPSTSAAGDVPGGLAVNLGAIAPSLDRIRLMTLDYSSDQSDGPTTDPDWISEVAMFAQSRRGATTASMDFALPLYGVDFSERGQRQITYTEAVGLAQNSGQQLARGSGQSLYFSWDEDDGTTHDTWFDDADSTIYTERQIDMNLDGSYGVLYYGLGFEDPSLFKKVADLR